MTDQIWCNKWGRQETWNTMPPGSGLEQMAYLYLNNFSGHAGLKRLGNDDIARTAVFEEHGILVDLDDHNKILGIEKILSGHITIEDLCLVLSLITVDKKWGQ